MAAFAHYMWLGNWHTTSTASPLVVVQRRMVTHGIHFLAKGRARVRWIHRGREKFFEAEPATVRLDPADDEEHTFIGANGGAVASHSVFSMLVPEADAAAVLKADGVDALPTLNRLQVNHDAVLSSCMARLSRPFAEDDDPGEAGKEEAARRLLLRWFELSGGVQPDWCADTGTFHRRAMANVVSYIDAHLRTTPTLEEMARITGLSPSHFAKKFRLSTGLSLHRFVNVRRIQASLQQLRGDSASLADMALGLGFSSQSHFTRVFGELTGMTPARYRKNNRRRMM